MKRIDAAALDLSFRTALACDAAGLSRTA